MKFARPFFALICALSVLAFAGCSDEVLKGEQAFFEPIATPTATPVTDKTLLKRRSENFAGELIASDSYGELIPFAGDILTYKSTVEGAADSFSAPLMGLCTLNGEIIVDPVYDSVITYNLDGDMKLLELTVGTKRYLTNKNGSWIFELKKGWTVSDIYGNERFVIRRVRTGKQNGKTVETVYYDVYNYNGKKMFTAESKLSKDTNVSFTVGKFSEGLAPINVSTFDPVAETTTVSAFYIDVNGKRAFEGFTSAGEFKGGLAVVVDQNGLFGIIKPSGEYYIEPKYKQINYNCETGHFVCNNGDHFIIFDKDKNIVTTVQSKQSEIEVLGYKTLIYKKTIPATKKTEYYSITNNKPLICDETGQFPDENSGQNGIFYCSYSNVTNIFGEDGKTIESYTDFGNIPAFVGNKAVVVNKSNVKFSLLDTENSEKTDWINGTFTGEIYKDRYIVVKSNNMYSLFDTESGVFTIENCDYITAVNFSSGNMLQTVKEGYVTLYNTDFKEVMYFNNAMEVVK